MNAVNLLPAQYRSRRMSASVSTPFLAVAAGLLVILLATFLFVSSENKVSGRRTQLAQLQAAESKWSAVTSRYSAASAQAQEHAAEETSIGQLATSRFNWTHLLGQVAALMPADAQLSSLQASAPGTSAGTATGSGSTSSSIQVSACATSQTAVAQTMVQLHEISGVKSVTLSSSTNSGTSGSNSGSGSGSGGGCGLPVSFQLTLAFANSAAASGAPAASPSATDTNSSTSTPTSTTSTQ